MDDLRLLRELERDRPLRRLEELAVQRNRLLEAVRTQPHGVRAHATPRLRPATAWTRWLRSARRRWAVAMVGAMAVTMAVTVALVVGTSGGGDRAARDGGSAEAILVLHRAASRQAGLPDLVPRPDQFVYTESRNGGGGVREAWLSVDGTRDGLVHNPGEAADPIPGCHDGRAAVVKGSKVIPGTTQPCTPSPAYQPDLPTNVDGMLVYLEHHGGVPGDPNAMGKAVLALVEEQYLRPPVRAALFEAATRIPGLRLIRNVTDGAGRNAVGVAWSRAGLNGLLVFDPNDYSLLGVASGSGGDVVLRQAIVDEVGQR